MRPSLITCLALSSLLLLSGCAISHYKHLSCDKIILLQRDMKPVLPASGMVRYKASVDVLKNHLSGILIVKKTDSLGTRLVFVTELGMKIFDFEARDNSMNAVYVFGPLNKPVLIEALKRNFSNLLLLNAYGQEAGACHRGGAPVYQIKDADTKRYFSLADPTTKALGRQDTFHKRRHESRAEYTYDPASGLYSHIQSKQYGLVKFYFELNLIPPSHD